MHQQWRPILRAVHPLFRQSSPWNEAQSNRACERFCRELARVESFLRRPLLPQPVPQ